jgi:ATP-dependent Clp protease adaptor protein ClpS
MYNVLLLNDDYTPMEFVVMVLEKIFNKKQEEATQIMLHVHKNGIGVCGTFTYEVAESKCKSVMDMAKKMNILYNAQWKKVNAVTKFRKNIKRSISTSNYL